MNTRLKLTLQKYTPELLKRIIYRFNIYPNFKPAVGHINWGDFNRIKPFSNQFGFDRGGPVDRYYIENFLAKEAKLIKGNVLEVADQTYSLQFGAEKVTKFDVLHVNENAPGATYVADLGQENDMPSNHFDCIILTQTLQFIYDYKLALKNCYRMLKKGGSLLVTVPGISPIELGEWHKYWLWTFNDALMQKTCNELFSEENFVINSYGNVYSAISFLHGIGLPEIDQSKLDFRDHAFDVIITLRLTK